MIFPLFLSTPIARNECPSSVAVVIQTCSPKITGEDHPCPGISVLNATFFDSDQVNASPVASECPCCPAPRNSGQFSSPKVAPTNNKHNRNKLNQTRMQPPLAEHGEPNARSNDLLSEGNLM